MKPKFFPGDKVRYITEDYAQVPAVVTKSIVTYASSDVCFVFYNLRVGAQERVFNVPEMQVKEG